MSVTDPIRVCHISTVHVPHDVRIFVRECRSLVKAGYEVHLIIDVSEADMVDGVHIHPLKKPKNRFLRMLLSPWRALFEALKTRAHIYHYHDPELLFVGFILHWLLGKKVIYDVHECVYRQILTKPYLPPGIARIVSSVFRVVERWLGAGQILVVANDNSMADYPDAWLVRNYPLCDDRLVVKRRSFGPQAGRPQLVYLGGVADIRGVWVYVELARRLSLQGRDFEMWIMGPYTPELGYALKNRIAQWDLHDKVHVTGRMDWIEAMHRIAKASIGLCLLLPVPNYTTCLATKILEYMMVGTPVLASDFDCWRPYVEGEAVGRMADPTDMDQVVSVCKQMLDNPQQLSLMSRKGRTAIRTKYNWEQEFQQLLRCYKTLLKQKYEVRRESREK